MEKTTQFAVPEGHILLTTEKYQSLLQLSMHAEKNGLRQDAPKISASVQEGEVPSPLMDLLEQVAAQTIKITTLDFIQHVIDVLEKASTTEAAERDERIAHARKDMSNLLTKASTQENSPLARQMIAMAKMVEAVLKMPELQREHIKSAILILSVAKNLFQEV